MPLGKQLISAVSAVNWLNNIHEFSSESSFADIAAEVNYQIALWSKQLENADKGNLALSFIREAQAQAHYSSTLISLGLYKPAAGSMRTIVECALYYTYYRSHPAELRTLVRDPDYHIGKRNIIDYHKRHTINFESKQEAVGLLANLNEWYSDISGIVHGQAPGEWVTHLSLENINFDKEVCKLVLKKYKQGGLIFSLLLLCTVDTSLWYSFESKVKTQLLKGFNATQKEKLGLTKA